MKSPEQWMQFYQPIVTDKVMLSVAAIRAIQEDAIADKQKSLELLCIDGVEWDEELKKLLGLTDKDCHDGHGDTTQETILNVIKGLQGGDQFEAGRQFQLELDCNTIRKSANAWRGEHRNTNDTCGALVRELKQARAAATVAKDSE